jgi:hypothetical protein
MAEQKKINPIQALISIAVILAAIWYFFGGGLEHQAAKNMEGIERKVASDAVQQYEIAKRSGTPMDACVHAGFVAAAFLQAKDEAAYQQWKQTERVDCDGAGIHR